MSHYSSNRFSRASYEPNFLSSGQYETPGTKQIRTHLPQSALNRHLSPGTRATSSYKSVYASPKPSSSDFFNTLVGQMHRIDESFSLEWSEDTPLQQALNCLVQAIDVIEAQRMQGHSYYPDSRISEAYEGEEYESRLKGREERLEKDEAALLRERNMVNAEKDKVKKLKEHYLNLESELKQQKLDLEHKEKEDSEKIMLIKDQLESELNEIAEQKRTVDREILEINLLKTKLDEYNQSLSEEREELERERQKIFEKNLELDKEVWKLETEKAQLDEKVAITSHMREKIEHELQQIELERAEMMKAKIQIQTENLKQSDYRLTDEDRYSLQSERLALAEERERLLLEEEKFAQILAQYEADQLRLVEDRKSVEKDKQAVIEEREAVDEAWDEIEEKQGSQTGGRKGQDEYAAMLEELQSQMAKYNKELENKEKELDSKSAEISRREEEVERKLEEIQNVEFSLMRAKKDLEELSLGTIPELETQSQHIQHILADLLVKRNEVDSGYSQLQAKIIEFERTKSQSRNANDINRMADELENKIKRIREREEELANLEHVLDKEKKENLSHALYLQRAEKEFNESCAKKETEIEATTKKLEKLQIKLESAIQLMNAKENELLSLKEQLIENRGNM